MNAAPHRILLEVAAALLACGAAALPAQPLAPPPDPSAAVAARGGAACAGGVAFDDGTAETGYGWIPSVDEGEYVQRFESGLFPSRRLETVCVCWIRTQADADVDYEVVFYADAGGVPAAEPYASVPASAVVAPLGVVGTFFEVDVTGVTLPPGPSYVGARWSPSTDPFFFLCTDTSDATPPVEVFFRDELAEGEWGRALGTPDPTFIGHRALMVRARAAPPAIVEVPALGAGGLALFAALLAAAALARFRMLVAEPIRERYRL